MDRTPKHLQAPHLRDTVKGGEVDDLLRICEAFTRVGRPIPGHLRTALVRLAPYWGKRAMPAEIIEAQKILKRVRQ